MLNECYTLLYMFKGRYDCMNMVIVGHNKHIWLNWRYFYVQLLYWNKDMFYFNIWFMKIMKKLICKW